jgi:hypothetical protein
MWTHTHTYGPKYLNPTGPRSRARSPTHLAVGGQFHASTALRPGKQSPALCGEFSDAVPSSDYRYISSNDRKIEMNWKGYGRKR